MEKLQDKSSFQSIVSNQSGKVYQCGRGHCFFLEFQGNLHHFTTRQFLDFQYKVNQLDVETMLTSTQRCHDLEIISAPGTNHVFVLTAHEALSLGTLLNQTRYLLEAWRQHDHYHAAELLSV